MNLIINCIIDNLVNNSSTSFDWVIPNVRYRETINTQILLNYWYKKEGKKHLYLRDIKSLKYELQKMRELNFKKCEELKKNQRG